MHTPNYIAEEWFARNGWEAYRFQQQCWDAIADGQSGMLNAPTGYGKTYAVWMGILEQYFKQTEQKGLHALWITPLRALSKEILLATQRVSEELNLDYEIALRTGDTPNKERTSQKKKPPQALVTTPESVHLMLAQKGYKEYFGRLDFVVIDEWHELMGTKRGVLVELALARLRAIRPDLRIWGISATIGNLVQAKDILLGNSPRRSSLVTSDIEKKITIRTVLPDTIERYPWAGHMGIKLIDKVLPIIYESTSTILFTNTRSQCEIWYQRLLDADPELAGQIALHHGSLSEELRLWVEEALHEGQLKAVVSTSSLDLGVDFRPVDTVVQIGSPKGVARFLQRAGRSGHQPGAESRIWFLPTHSLEIIEGSALREAVKHKDVEQRVPYIRSFDVLVQYLVTLSVSEGFTPDELFPEIAGTHCFASISREEFDWCLQFITHGGQMLDAYEEFHKVVVIDGVYRVTSRKIAMRHRMNIGAIVSETMVMVKFIGGRRIGMVEEGFISRLKPGDAFTFAGNRLELIRIKDNSAIVKNSISKKGATVSWQGGRMPLSSQLSGTIRHQLNEFYHRGKRDTEIKILAPLFDEQQRRSHLPHEDELLIEKIKTRDGYHVFMYPFEGRNVHEGMATLFGYRIAQIRPMSFSIAFNDYGFELLSDQEIPLEEALENGLFSLDNLNTDISSSINIAEMARRRFRDIARIAGLIFQGYPGKQMKSRHVQANSQLFFSVFSDHEKDNLLLQQAYDEVMIFQMEQIRMVEGLERMQKQKVVLQHPTKLTPFCFPIFAERFREKLSNEKMEDRIEKIIRQLEK